MKYLLLFVSFVIYSFSGVFGKVASMYPLLSWQYVCFIIADFFMLGIYSIMWQQILKRIKLSTAMSWKPLTVLLGSLWGIVLFKEKLTITFFISMFFIILGIGVIISDEK